MFRLETNFSKKSPKIKYSRISVQATTARDLPMRPLPLSLDPTPRPTLTRGIPTMEDMAMELTDLMDMATTLTVLTVTLTGDKK